MRRTKSSSKHNKAARFCPRILVKESSMAYSPPKIRRLPTITISKAIFLLGNLYNNLPLSFPKGSLKCKTGDWKHSVWFLRGERSLFQDTLTLWPSNWIPSVRLLNLKDSAARRVVNTNLAAHWSCFSGIGFLADRENTFLPLMILEISRNFVPTGLFVS